MTYPQEFIPDEDNVFRNVHIMRLRDWGNDKRRPNEADFILRDNEEGLSVNWEKYINAQGILIDLGLEKNATGKYRIPHDFRVLKLGVGDLRAIQLISGGPVDVIHKPENNKQAHAEICCEANVQSDVEFRLKLCDLIESQGPPFVEVDRSVIEDEIEKRKL